MRNPDGIWGQEKAQLRWGIAMVLPGIVIGLWAAILSNALVVGIITLVVLGCFGIGNIISWIDHQ